MALSDLSSNLLDLIKGKQAQTEGTRLYLGSNYLSFKKIYGQDIFKHEQTCEKYFHLHLMSETGLVSCKSSF